MHLKYAYYLVQSWTYVFYKVKNVSKNNNIDYNV